MTVTEPSEPAAAGQRAADTDALVAQARRGDVGAFEALYRQHAGRVHALCLRMTGRSQEAEELAQEAFVRAWQKLPGFEGRSAFSSWLHRLTVNVVLSRWRTDKRRPTLTALDAVAETRATRTRASRKRVDLERAIAQLPRGARTVFVLHDVEGYLHREVAELTGLSPGTSKAQLHRARRLLRRALDGDPA